MLGINKCFALLELPPKADLATCHLPGQQVALQQSISLCECVVGYHWWKVAMSELEPCCFSASNVLVL
jgi:hypothetical protein